MIYITTTKRNRLVGVAFSPEHARAQARCSQSPKCLIRGYREGSVGWQFYEVVDNLTPQPKPLAAIALWAAEPPAFYGTSYAGPRLNYAHLLPSVHWHQESPKESGWYWASRLGSRPTNLDTVRWFEVGWGWSVATPVNCTPETAAHMATCRAEIQTDIRWDLIDRSKL